jgi:hypothetical protein
MIAEEAPEERALDAVKGLAEIHKGTVQRSRSLGFRNRTQYESCLPGTTTTPKTKLGVGPQLRRIQGTREAAFKETCVEFREDGSNGNTTEIRGGENIAFTLIDRDKDRSRQARGKTNSEKTIEEGAKVGLNVREE